MKYFIYTEELQGGLIMEQEKIETIVKNSGK